MKSEVLRDEAEIGGGVGPTPMDAKTMMDASTKEARRSDDVEAVETGLETPRKPTLPLLDRFLLLWILLAMALGILLGNFVPSTAPALLHHSTLAGVSAPLAIGLLLMMYPILCKVRYEALPSLFRTRGIYKQLGLSVLLNWVVAPLVMLALAWAFLPDKPALRTGLIYVGIARCIAMVLIWNELAGGDAEFCAVLVAVNSLLQILLFAPLALFYVDVVSRTPQTAGIKAPGYATVASSVAVFLGIPLGAGLLTRAILLPLLGPERYAKRFLRYISPLSLLALLYTIAILFASQGARVVHQITSVLRVVCPLLVYFLVLFAVALLLCRWLGCQYEEAVTQAFTAASNNFELAIAVVVSVYGADSDQALASTVGPLVEVPVLVTLVYAMRLVGRRWGWAKAITKRGSRGQERGEKGIENEASPPT